LIEKGPITEYSETGGLGAEREEDALIPNLSQSPNTL